MTDIYAPPASAPAPPPAALPLLDTLRAAGRSFLDNMGEILFALVPVVLVGAALSFNILKLVLEGFDARPVLIPFMPVWAVVLLLAGLSLLAFANAVCEIYRIVLRRKVELVTTLPWRSRIGWTVFWLFGFWLAAAVLGSIPMLGLQALVGKLEWVPLVALASFGLALLALLARYGAIFPALALGVDVRIGDAANWVDGNGWRMAVLYLIPAGVTVGIGGMSGWLNGVIARNDSLGLSGPTSLLMLNQLLFVLPILVQILLNAAAFARLHRSPGLPN
jgi:hypothetical protein